MVDERTYGGRYRVVERIAGGGMGTVFEGIDERLDRPVAIKVLNSQLAEDPSFVERFRREARSVAGLSHQHIATVFDYGEDAGDHFIVMELVKGRDLARIMRDEGPLDADRAATLVAQVCDALHHAHEAGVVHRDVKPANVIVSDDGHAHVTDFGIARAGGDATLTRPGTVFGSAHYIAPEQAGGGRALPASDVYSAGVVLFELVTGALPFTGESPIAVAMRHMSEPVPPPSELNPDVPSWFDAVVARATAKNPDERFSSAAEMATALRDRNAVPATTAVGAAVMDATRPLPVAPVGPPPPRRDNDNLTRVGLALLGILLLVGIGIALANALGDDEPTRRTRRDSGAAPQTAAPTSARPETEAPPSTTAAGVLLPNVVGSNFSEAASVLEDEGFEVVEQEQTDDEPQGTVVAMDPAPDEFYAEGTTVTLFVSTGEPGEEEENEEDEGDATGPPDHAKDKDKDKED